MKKRAKAVKMLATVIVLIFSLSLVACGSNSDNEDYLGKKIDFQNSVDGVLDPEAELKFDIAELNSQLAADKTYYFSEDPVVTDYEIASELGFDKENFEPSNDGERIYSANGKDTEKRLKIDKYGRFSFDSGIKVTSDEVRSSDSECIQIAKKFLENCGLFIDGFGAEASVETAESTYSASEGTKTTAKCVVFVAEGPYTRSAATVNINADGEIVKVTYNVKNFKIHRKVRLIPLTDAIERIKQNNALINLGMATSYSKLEFEKVSVSYYEQATENGGITVQPVYIFEGTTVASDDQTADFRITVQANRYK